ncbi:copper amine oxidase N-terminal domain-containing protein [Paenibacillus dokdonensis]|uniref:Copper amine oxidase N-terminal domain-containing protein n=1 Tax=Paenibacillus dokdonensis TaxID=2567944 RepID=A0ABU6GKL3_9BACL|nr:copper amine oxidase N-terminal domain-containing protein [Paenibacillus dokdonensis]MEC0239998.1 copper amine oxidase N-terminal domain-containing protein [Paenibacillus dokdonensis]
MKKVFSAIFFALIVIMTASPTYAADTQIKVEGVVIASDVKPEMKNNRTMVPLRVISEHLGAKVHWSGSEVTLSKSSMKVILRLDSSTAVKNGKKVHLDVKPYLKHNRIIVPLRFIAETFGGKVGYNNYTVTVDPGPLVIDGVKVTALQQEYYFMMGGIVNQIKGNANIEVIYNNFVDNKGSKVEAPSDYTWSLHSLTPGAYYKMGQYDFLDQEGNSIKQFDIYSLSVSTPKAGPELLIYDATENQWYLFNDEANKSMYQFIDTAAKNGFLTVISNTLP